MNNAFTIKERAGIMPWLLRKINKKRGVDIYLSTCGVNLLQEGVTQHYAPIGPIVPYTFEDIAFTHNIDDMMYQITKYKMPEKAAFN